MHRIIFYFFIILLLSHTACVQTNDSYSKLAPGIWRAGLNLDAGLIPNIYEAISENESSTDTEEIESSELPFNFEVVYSDNQDIYVNLINGKEKIRIDDVYYGRDLTTAKDTILINFSVYDSYIKAIVEERVMEGRWYVNNRTNYSIPFVARQGQDFRFSQLKKQPAQDLTGNWECKFSPDTDDEYMARGEFMQSGNHLEGTFVTETGDYRYLEGTVQDDRVYLSVFDGAHAFLFEAKILADGSLIGIFRSGKHYKTTWLGVRNENFKLTDPNKLTYLKDGYDKIEFKLPNPDNEIISLLDDEYRGNPVIVQILGTWCPNCWDETKFLVDYLENTETDDLKIIGISFEKHKDADKAKQAIRNYREKMNIPYELVWGGSSNKAEAVNTLPMLNKIISYPTMIFIDREGAIQKIHTGFSGPATSEYESFKEEFKNNIALITGSGI